MLGRAIYYLLMRPPALGIGRQLFQPQSSLVSTDVLLGPLSSCSAAVDTNFAVKPYKYGAGSGIYAFVPT